MQNVLYLIAIVAIGRYIYKKSEKKNARRGIFANVPKILAEPVEQLIYGLKIMPIPENDKDIVSRELGGPDLKIKIIGLYYACIIIFARAKRVSNDTLLIIDMSTCECLKRYTLLFAYERVLEYINLYGQSVWDEKTDPEQLLTNTLMNKLKYYKNENHGYLEDRTLSPLVEQCVGLVVKTWFKQCLPVSFDILERANDELSEK